MDVTEIQKEVRHLPAAQRRKLTAWMVTEYPALSVEGLMTRAQRSVKSGKLVPTPPTHANIPSGRTLEHALNVAARLGLKK